MLPEKVNWFGFMNCFKVVFFQSLRFEKLQAQHASQYQSLLQSIMQSGPAPTAEAAAVVREEQKDETETPALTTFESVDKLKEKEDILLQCVSEVNGIEILKTKSGKVYLVAEKKRILPKNTLVGGFGTGKLLSSV